MRIGFFGGSFDPPHTGHLAVARAAADAFALDRVLLAPTGMQPLKPAGSSAPFADRLAMTRLLAEEDPRCVASDIDAPRAEGANYTVDTLTRLRAALPAEDTLFCIAGADSFASLPEWRDPARLLTLAEWIVVSRPGHDTTQAIDTVLRALHREDARPRIHCLENVAIPTSATGLRDTLSSASAPGDALTPAVRAYIAEHRLYGVQAGAAAARSPA